MPWTVPKHLKPVWPLVSKVEWRYLDVSSEIAKSEDFYSKYICRCRCVPLRRGNGNWARLQGWWQLLHEMEPLLWRWFQTFLTRGFNMRDIIHPWTNMDGWIKNLIAFYSPLEGNETCPMQWDILASWELFSKVRVTVTEITSALATWGVEKIKGTTIVGEEALIGLMTAVTGFFCQTKSCGFW